jgi:hypothetical protein
MTDAQFTKLTSLIQAQTHALHEIAASITAASVRTPGYVNWSDVTRDLSSARELRKPL